MTPAQAGVLAAAALAAGDVALPLRSPTPGWRRLLRAAPAGLLAVLSRGADAPALLGLSLFLLALADAADVERTPEFGAAELATRTVALLVVAAFALEMGGTARLAAPWPWLAGLMVGGAGAALLLRRPMLRTGPVGVLAPLPPLAAGAVALTAVTLPSHLLLVAVGCGLLILATGVELAFRPGAVTRTERALRSLAALALAWPFLRPV